MSEWSTRLIWTNLGSNPGKGKQFNLFLLHNWHQNHKQFLFNTKIVKTNDNNGLDQFVPKSLTFLNKRIFKHNLRDRFSCCCEVPAFTENKITTWRNLLLMKIVDFLKCHPTNHPFIGRGWAVTHLSYLSWYDR